MQIDNAFLFAISVIGVIAFSISGATASIAKGLDIVGIIVLTVLTSLGGGVIRDLTLGITPPNLFINPEYYVYFGESVLVAVICFIIAFHNKKNDTMLSKAANSKILYVTDAIGLGVFCISGVDLAIRAGFADKPLVCIFAGVISGTGGSMIRDTILNEIPILFKKYIYIIPTVIGTLIYYLLYNVINEVIAFLIGAVVIMTIRILAIFLKWNLPNVHENPDTSLHISEEKEAKNYEEEGQQK